MVTTLQIFGLIAMILFMIVFTWGLVVLNKLYSQIKYKNYILEKVAQYLQILSKKDSTNNLKN